MSTITCGKTDPAAERSPARNRLLRWLALWLVLYVLSILAYNASYAFTRDVLIYHTQVRPAAWIASHTLSDRPVWHDRTSLLTPGVQLEIRRGCDGMEAWLMLVTALLVFPMSWRRRGRAIALGTLLIFGLNLIRIVTMLHLVVARPEWFEVAHGLVWQSIMVVSVALFVMVQFEARPTASKAEGAAA